MGVFNFLRKKKLPIDFSEEKVSELTKKSDLLGQTLIDNGFGFYVDYLSQIRLAADNKNEIEFRRLVLSNELFGGSGALCEIYIGNQSEYHKFEKQFSQYIELLFDMGINDRRVRQIKKYMGKRNKN